MSVKLKNRLPIIAAELRPHVEAAVALGAERISQSAKDRVPVHTGRLRNAIHVDRRGHGEYRVVAGDHEAFYGHLVEFGTNRAPAQPFLVPAAEENRRSVEALVTTALRRLK